MYVFDVRMHVVLCTACLSHVGKEMSASIGQFYILAVVLSMYCVCNIISYYGTVITIKTEILQAI